MKKIDPKHELQKEYYVEESHSAKKIGSGTLEVLSSPMLVAYMENCAMELLETYCEDNETSVGIAMVFNHIKASQLKRKILVKAKIEEIDKSKITFLIKAYDQEEFIGEATHIRYMITIDSFMNRLKKRK